MSIFTLYQNFMELNYHTITKEEAAYYVKSFVLKQAPDIHFTEKKKCKWEEIQDILEENYGKGRKGRFEKSI